MNTPTRACVVLSDYPVKSMAYQRFLHNLNEEHIHHFRSVELNFSDLRDAKLVVCDMNIMRDLEADALKLLERQFPKANILFLEEDHADMLTKFANDRDICRLGKLSEVGVIHATLKELLLRQNKNAGKKPASRKKKPTLV